MEQTADYLNSLTNQIIGAAIDVHRMLGCGLLESAYEACLTFELRKRGLRIERQKPLPLTYRDVKLNCAYRMDLVVEGCVVVEVKSVSCLGRVHGAQLLSYLKAADLRVGIVLNFSVKQLTRGGIMRRVNRFPG